MKEKSFRITHTVLDNKLPKVQQNAELESGKVEVIGKNHLSPQEIIENGFCKTKCRLILVNVMQNKKSPDKLQDKKIENIGKLPCEKN